MPRGLICRERAECWAVALYSPEGTLERRFLEASGPHNEPIMDETEWGTERNPSHGSHEVAHASGFVLVGKDLVIADYQKLANVKGSSALCYSSRGGAALLRFPFRRTLSLANAHAYASLAQNVMADRPYL